MRRRQFICTAAVGFMAAATRGMASQAEMIVYKDPNCGCCQAWVEAMMDADFAVTVRDVDNLSAIKMRYAIPEALQGCHTAIVGEYFFEGHVPLEAVETVLSKQPRIAGLAVPGMPPGSLGMGGTDAKASYDVYSLSLQGRVEEVFMRIRPS